MRRQSDLEGQKFYKLCSVVLFYVIASFAISFDKVEMKALDTTRNSSFTPNSSFTTSVDPAQASEIITDRGKQKRNDVPINTTILSQTFHDIMSTYDKKFRPFYGGKPVTVKLDFHVLSFGKIKEVEMEYGIDFYFAQIWTDPRFNASELSGETAWIELIGSDIDRIWVPDTIFINSKSSEFHRVTLENRFMAINLSNGEMVYHSRITLSGSCRMDLRSYPFDEQTCYLAIESYGHDNRDVIYEWRKDNCIGDCDKVLIYETDLANFKITEARKFQKKTLYHTENFSWAAAKFVFKRQTNFFILQVYLPCIMIVMVSWSSFWICRDAVPARAAISVTTILTIITMLGVVNSNMPKVSYVKALDFYLFISFVFVFLSLGEYIIVLNADRFPLPPYFRKRSVKENKGLKKLVILIDKNDDPYSSVHNGDAHEHNPVQNGHARKRFDFGFNSISGSKHRDKGEEKPLKSSDVGKVLRSPRTVDKILNLKTSMVDKVSRILFPVCFCLFNIGYWIIYLK